MVCLDGGNVQLVAWFFDEFWSSLLVRTVTPAPRKISIGLRRRILMCDVWPIMSYASETWTMSKRIENKIHAFEKWCYRRPPSNQLNRKSNEWRGASAYRPSTQNPADDNNYRSEEEISGSKIGKRQVILGCCARKNDWEVEGNEPL